MLVCYAFIFSQVLTLIRYFIKVDFMFGLRDYICQIEDFVISRFIIWRLCSTHFTVTFARPKNIVRYIKDFVKKSFVKSRFHCRKLAHDEIKSYTEKQRNF